MSLKSYLESAKKALICYIQMQYNHTLHFNVQGFCYYFLNFFAQDIPVRCTFGCFWVWETTNIAVRCTCSKPQSGEIFVEILFQG